VDGRVTPGHKRFKEGGALLAVLFLDELGAQRGEGRHHAVEGGAHLGLELAVLGTALVEEALGHREPRIVTGQSDPEFGALPVEIGTQAEIAADNPAGDAGDQHAGLNQVTEIDVGGEIGMSIIEVLNSSRVVFGYPNPTCPDLFRAPTSLLPRDGAGRIIGT